VPAEEQCKGFEVEDGKYVIVDPEDLEQTTPESSRMIEVHEFVKTEQIDPIFLDRLYYLEPDIPEQHEPGRVEVLHSPPVGRFGSALLRGLVVLSVSKPLLHPHPRLFLSRIV
jgi:hypothetical protein